MRTFRDNDLWQWWPFPSGCAAEWDLCLILDVSGSVEEEYALTIELAKLIVYGIDMRYDRTRVAALAYSTDIVDYFYLDAYQVGFTEKEMSSFWRNFHHWLHRKLS